VRGGIIALEADPEVWPKQKTPTLAGGV